MKFQRIKCSVLMTFHQLIRNRIAVILFFIIPSLFFLLIVLTNTDRLITFKLGAMSSNEFIQVSEKKESLIFIGLAAIGLLSSFLSLNLIQKDFDVNRRLVLCGYSSTELIFSKLLVLLISALIIVIYVSLILTVFFRPMHYLNVIIGYLLGGFVYGCYGLLIGSIFRGELEGILFIVLMANIDAGWLQNPVYYSDSQNQFIIRILPAFFPSQVSMVSAFTNYPITEPLIGSIVYGLIFLISALIIYQWRMR